MRFREKIRNDFLEFVGKGYGRTKRCVKCRGYVRTSDDHR